jgi:hypothetical protein
MVVQESEQTLLDFGWELVEANCGRMLHIGLRRFWATSASEYEPSDKASQLRY